MPGQEPERHPGRAQLDDPVVGADVRQVVAGVGHHDPAGLRLQDREQAGDEHPRRHLGHEQLVGPGEDHARRIASRRLGAQDGVRPGHDQRRRDALVGDVADGDPDPPAGHLDEVVEVAADGPRRAVVGGDLPLVELRQLARQELLLDEGRDAHLLLEPLAFGGLGGLLADELGDPDRRGGLGGEGRQEAAVVGRVVLLGQPRPEIEGADQLALGDERDDERDAGLAQGADRRRVQLEPGDLDRPGGGLEVGEERVGLGDIDGDRWVVGRRASAPRRPAGVGTAAGSRAASRRPSRRRIGRVSSVISWSP